MKVNEIMTSSVVSVLEDATVEDAARLLAHQRISGLPVVNAAGKLVGLVTEYDLIAKTGATSRGAMRRPPPLDLPKRIHRPRIWSPPRRRQLNDEQLREHFRSELTRKRSPWARGV